jgi:elongator complex protein 1
MFLVDPDKLFDIALGMYDFSLVLLIAQNSQKVESNLIRFFTQLSAEKDPREYLPFLRELWSLDESYRHYRINDHLKRYPSALRSLWEGGDILCHKQ